MFPLDLLLSLLLSFVFILLLIKFAPSLKLVDIPNDRSFHKNHIPKGGGIGFSLAALGVIAFCDFQLFMENYLTFLAIFIVLITGIIDDIKNCRPRFKFITIFFAVVLLYIDGCTITTLGDYSGLQIELYWMLVFPFTYFAVVGFTNALNLIDGIDGLAGGVAFIILGTFLAIGVKFEDSFMILLSASFMFALIGFLFLNWNPAKIFMGDSGSLTLGFVIAVLAIKSLAYINPTLVLFIAALPILDTMMVMVRRKQRSQSLFKADKNHLHHILHDQKRDVKFTATILWMLQFIFSMIGYRSIGQDDTWNIVLFIVLFYVFFNLFDPRLRRRKRKKKQSPIEEKKSIIQEKTEGSTI
ncbi:MAG: MraY family glycosyltransferase [Campylobacterota bacterium]|nr:MraY family glycosyltransferase [Campylobacterota bacterium]